MVSERKREANRKNAQKPRGPRKKAKAFHPYEDFGTFYWDLDLFAELQEGYRETLHPQNKLEETLVEMLCHATLRLKRVPYLEHEYHATHRHGFLFNERENHFGPFYRAESKLFYQQLSRYETSAQRSFYKALNTLLKLQNDGYSRRSGPCVRPPQQPEPLPLPIPSALHRERADTRSAPTEEATPITPKPPKKTSQISHPTPPTKPLKTQAQPANSPTANRWLTQTLATVRQKIKAFTQTFQTGIFAILQISCRGAACCAHPTSQTLYLPVSKGSTPTTVAASGAPTGDGVTSPKGPAPPDTS